MSDMQSTLGGEQGIAEELAEGQRQISIAEFFEKNKHMLGFDSPGRSIVTAVKEAVDNALDAAEEGGFLPEISVQIEEAGDYYRVTVEDNGPGITEEQVPKVFGRLLYGSRFGKREQNRGQQGIGISAAVLYSQLTSGKPARITSKTGQQEEARYFELIIDTEDNTAEIRKQETTEWDSDHGTQIELEMEANMRARKQLHQYIRYTAVVNPHASISLEEPQKSLSFDRTTDELPSETKEIQPHPHGVELGTLLKMLASTESYSISGFLQEEFTRVGQKTADEIVGAFKDRHFGRGMRWRVPDDTDELESVLLDAVRNKGREPTEGFVEELLDQLPESVTYDTLKETVASAAQDAMDEFGKTFGATVRENAVRASWGIIAGDTVEELIDHVDAATSNRKSDETIRLIAEEIDRALNDNGHRYRVTKKKLRNIVDTASDAAEERSEDVTVGQTARDNIFEQLWENTERVPDDAPNVSDVADSRDLARELLNGMNATRVMAPPTDCLSPITSDLVEQGLKKVYDADFYAASTRDAEVHSGEPFIAEAGIAYGGNIDTGGSAEVLRFANRVPLVYMQGSCAITSVIKNIGWRNYKVSQTGDEGVPDENMVILVHVASTNVPFTSESKDAVAKVEGIMDEIELAVREAARELKSHLRRQSDLRERKEKRDALRDIFPDLSEKAAQVTGGAVPNWRLPLANIMNDVLVKRTHTEDNLASLTVENYTRKERTLTIHEQFNSKPDGRRIPRGDTVSVDENDDGTWTLSMSFTLASGEDATVTYPTTDIHDMPSASGIDEELRTIETEHGDE